MTKTLEHSVMYVENRKSGRVGYLVPIGFMGSVQAEEGKEYPIYDLKKHSSGDPNLIHAPFNRRDLPQGALRGN